MDATKNNPTNPPHINITHLANLSVAFSVAAIIASTMLYDDLARPFAFHPPTGAQAIAPLIAASIPLLLSQIFAHHTLLRALREKPTTPRRAFTYAVAAVTLNTAWFTFLVIGAYCNSK